jgi:hemoglobin-like flavoprotein
MEKTVPTITSDEIVIVQITFTKALHISDIISNLFYYRLFELDPSLRPLSSENLTEQREKFMSTLKTVIFSLRQLDTITPIIRELGQRHVTYRVENRHYETVGTALFWALELGLVKDWTPQAKSAWVSAYTLIAQK